MGYARQVALCLSSRHAQSNESCDQDNEPLYSIQSPHATPSGRVRMFWIFLGHPGWFYRESSRICIACPVSCDLSHSCDFTFHRQHLRAFLFTGDEQANVIRLLRQGCERATRPYDSPMSGRTRSFGEIHANSILGWKRIVIWKANLDFALPQNGVVEGA